MCPGAPSRYGAGSALYSWPYRDPMRSPQSVRWHPGRILWNGPAALPVEQPMTFDFVVNVKTAQALGITFPNEILLQVT